MKKQFQKIYEGLNSYSAPGVLVKDVYYSPELSRLILERVAEHYHVLPEDLLVHRRQHIHVYARQMFCYILFNLCKDSRRHALLSIMGTFLRGRDRTTILYSINVIKDYITVDGDVPWFIDISDRKVRKDHDKLLKSINKCLMEMGYL